MATAIKPRVVLLDIEGTVCPISFVKDVLFPYALAALPQTLSASWDSPTFAPYRQAFPPEHARDPSAFATHVRELMAADAKVSYLKALQGHIWAEGYARGELKATLFADVAPRIRAWTTASKPEEDKDGEGEGVAATKVMIYSSGSVAAQKLLFGHTDGEPADLNPLLSGYFDTVTAGPKTERASYEAILAKAETAVPAGEWLFLSDNVREVEAAKEAGMQSFVVDRPGNAPLSEEDRRRHRVITSFDEL